MCTWNKELTEKENPSSDTLEPSEREELHRLHLEKREQAIEDGDRNHKKGDGLLRKRSKIKRYRFIDAEKTHYPIAVLCDVMKVSRSGFYAWKERPTKSNALLKVTIKSIHEESNGTYGSPRITQEMKNRNMPISHNTVSKFMRELGITGIPRRRRNPQSSKKQNQKSSRR